MLGIKPKTFWLGVGHRNHYTILISFLMDEQCSSTISNTRFCLRQCDKRCVCVCVCIGGGLTCWHALMARRGGDPGPPAGLNVDQTDRREFVSRSTAVTLQWQS